MNENENSSNDTTRSLSKPMQSVLTLGVDMETFSKLIKKKKFHMASNAMVLKLIDRVNETLNQLGSRWDEVYPEYPIKNDHIYIGECKLPL